MKKTFRSSLFGLLMPLLVLMSFAFSGGAQAAPILGPCCDPIHPANSTGPHSATVAPDFSTGPHSAVPDLAPADKPPVKVTSGMQSSMNVGAGLASQRGSSIAAGLGASLKAGGGIGVGRMAATSPGVAPGHKR